jgi:S1-C subfamily serine protease
MVIKATGKGYSHESYWANQRTERKVKKSTRIKDVIGGLMLGVMACLIFIACGSDQNAGAGNTQAPSTQAGSLATAGNGNVSTGFGSTTTASSVDNASNTGSSGNATSGAVPAGQVGAPSNQTVPLTPTGYLNQDVRNVIKAVRPAVVEIIAETSSTNNIGSIFGNGGSGGETGIGTGSIISPDGYILTNNHVVEGANKFTVVLPDGRQYDAQLIGREARTSDIAVIKIDPRQNSNQTLPVMKLGDSSKLEIGEAVVAIGNALGLEGGPTVTQGIVSAVGRSIQEPGGAQLSGLIQTDAAINPGNSGGPLLNLRGEQIGINTAAPVDPSQGVVANGIGFAININSITGYVQPFISGGTPAQGNGQTVFAEKPFMGILPQTVTAGLAAQYKLPVKQGVLIGRVDANTPAQQAGWQVGDIIVKMDNTTINTTDDLAGVLARHKAGDTVQATLVNRSGQQRTTQITFSRSPNS